MAHNRIGAAAFIFTCNVRSVLEGIVCCKNEFVDFDLLAIVLVDVAVVDADVDVDDVVVDVDDVTVELCPPRSQSRSRSRLPLLLPVLPVVVAVLLF